MSQTTPHPTEHDRFDYSPIVDRKPLQWPNGARVAVVGHSQHRAFSVRPSLHLDHPGDHAAGARRAQLFLARLRRARRHLAPHGGDGAHGVKGTVALNSDVCSKYPRIIEAGKQLGWEWMGHGDNNSTLINQQSEGEERELISEVVKTIKNSTGRQPRGWLSPALCRIASDARYSGRERDRICRQLGQ